MRFESLLSCAQGMNKLLAEAEARIRAYLKAPSDERGYKIALQDKNEASLKASRCF